MSYVIVGVLTALGICGTLIGAGLMIGWGYHRKSLRLGIVTFTAGVVILGGVIGYTYEPSDGRTCQKGYTYFDNHEKYGTGCIDTGDL